MNEFNFLVGTERSGSNLLTRLLDSHPELCGPPPLHMIRTLVNNIEKYGNLNKDRNWELLLQDAIDLVENQLGVWQSKFSPEELKENLYERSLHALICYIYRKEMACHGKNRVVVKENQTYNFITWLRQNFPEARYLYLVRDPRDFVVSWLHSPNHPGGALQAIQTWARDQENLLAIEQSSGEYWYRVCYEDLIRTPEETLKEVCAFLNVSYDPVMLRFYEKGETAQNARRLQNWGNLENPVLEGNYHKFKQELSEAAIKYIEFYCGKYMEAFGYAPLLEAPAEGEWRNIMNALNAQEAVAEQQKAIPPEEQKIRDKRLEVIYRIIHREPLE